MTGLHHDPGNPFENKNKSNPNPHGARHALQQVDNGSVHL
jgi:hypothetical protein